jgi:hypothetical protein
LLECLADALGATGKRHNCVGAAVDGGLFVDQRRIPKETPGERDKRNHCSE